MGTVVIPLTFGQTQPLLVQSGPILAGLVFLLDTAQWLANVLVAREAGALTVTGLVGGRNGRNAVSGWLVNSWLR